METAQDIFFPEAAVKELDLTRCYMFFICVNASLGNSTLHDQTLINTNVAVSDLSGSPALLSRINAYGLASLNI